MELSALRESELPGLMAALHELDLSAFTYISIHAPSRLRVMKESMAAKLLSPCIDRRWPVILHPDAIGDHGCWRDFGRWACIENMDNRKRLGRNSEELEDHFALLPEASFCLDLGHAQQVDPTLGVAREMLRDYRRRLMQLHLSELDVTAHHQPLSMASVWAVREIARLIPECPVIVESLVAPDAIDAELEMAAMCFDVNVKGHTSCEVRAPALA